MKPFYKRSEWWLTLFTHLIALSGIIKPTSTTAQLAAIALAGLSGGTYNIARGIAKQGTSN